MTELVKAIDRLNSTLRRQNHILMEANGLEGRTEYTKPDERLKQKEDNSNA